MYHSANIISSRIQTHTFKKRNVNVMKLKL